jgi:rhodanese-related sulfurtransferase
MVLISIQEEYMSTKLAISIAVALILSYMSLTANAADKTPDEMVREAKWAIKEISVGEVKRMIEADKSIVILDVRDRDEFETGHIPRAINLSRGMLEFKITLMIPEKSATVIVYCGIDLRGPLATKTLNDLGYRNAVNMIGGLKSWKEAGYPLEI